MQEEWENYLLNRVQLRDLKTRFKKKPKQPEGFGILDGHIHVASAQNAEPRTINMQEHDALVVAASEIDLKMVFSANEGQADEVDPADAGGFPEAISHGSSTDKGVLWPRVKVAEATDSGNANKPIHPKLEVYVLSYEDSTEMQNYETSIHRENRAFESLIREKSRMMIPVDQDVYCMGLYSSIEEQGTSSSSIEEQGTSSQNLVTRKAGGRRENDKEMQVIVDVRESMSSLPNVLDQKGMRIRPVEMMVRHYRIPVLLIEFSLNKSFSFQSASDIGDDIMPSSIVSKLSLLILHFPRLCIIWSRSVHMTADIFASLKANQDEPDEAKAIRVGVPSEERIIDNDVRSGIYNTSAVEFLRRLPGVTDSNYRTIMDGCKNLAELAHLPLEAG
ncbi:DNA repair protein [Trema orientale]|uniref:DNA repair protein n=1 Tax=Trema orientale TaxID=63057 RepID=A0A2P5EBS8_TREOI|nr:DNA repair protein [Trema orientale]